MNGLMDNVTGIVMAIVGVAILSVLVSRNNNTVGVISASTSGLSQLLGTAMSGANGAGVYGTGH